MKFGIAKLDHLASGCKAFLFITILYKSTNINYYRGKMEQDQFLEPSEEEKKALTVGLFREWWIASTKALVESVGSEEALRHLKPYFVNAGRAGAYHIKRLTGLPTDDAGSIMVVWIGIAHFQMSNAKVTVKASSKDYAIAEMTDCAINGACPEACYCWCLFVNDGGIYLNPDYETELIKCIPWGDSYCCIKASKKGITSIDNPSIIVPIPEISAKLANFLSHAYVGENWVNASRAFIDAVGSERASEVLCTKMRSAGHAVGENLVSKYDFVLDKPGVVVHSLNILHQKRESYSLNGSSQGEVTECPFSEAPLEICLQYEAFFNGICEVIDPSYEFAYDRMMTKGDKTCHWTIRKKGDAPKKKAREEPSKELGETAFELLKKRLVKGEITPEQYRQLRDILLEK
jgi:hypothetical protein